MDGIGVVIPLETRTGRLDGSTVLITGGSSGIGRATAQRCVREGAHVVVTDVDEEGGRETVAAFDGPGSGEFRYLDVREYDAFETVVDKIESDHGSLDVLVNNAGLAYVGLLEETSLDERDSIVDVNINGVWNGCRIVLPRMKSRDNGSIINVSSSAGLLGTPSLATYALTKAAIVNFTRALAGEAGPHGVRVNAVCPGTIETPLSESVMEGQDDPEAARESAEQAHPLHRLGQPEEVAACIAFLASNDASFVTGHALAVDGGSSAVLRSR